MKKYAISAILAIAMTFAMSSCEVTIDSPYCWEITVTSFGETKILGYYYGTEEECDKYIRNEYSPFVDKAKVNRTRSECLDL